MSLDELAARYLPPSTAQNPTYLRDSTFDAVLDGVDYFTDLHEAISAAGPGDSILLSGLQMEPDMDLRGLRAGDPEYRPIVDLLAEKAALGADVRVLLSGAVLSGSLPWPKIGPFRANNGAARTMRGWLPRVGRRRPHRCGTRCCSTGRAPVSASTTRRSRCCTSAGS